jgi:3-oxoacyl-(acyl-carrier-protein) synthase
MSSSASAFLGGLIGCGNQVSTNASACASGTEAILLGAERIRRGLADRMVCGACDSGSEYVRAGFDAMRVLNSRSNDAPQEASRPLSARAAGFVPSAAGGALVLERLSAAKARGARIYAEILGGAVNSGGQRMGGSMTAPNREAIRLVLRSALRHAQCTANSVDVISGHLTATRFDPYEIEAWTDVLGCRPESFPYVQALKSLTGHALSASGALEAVALTMQLHHGFLHPNLNIDPLHADVVRRIAEDRIPKTYGKQPLSIGMSASFGFGDVNACLVIKKYTNE